MIALLCAAQSSADARVRYSELRSLVQSFKGEPGFETVNLGWPVMKLIKVAMAAEAEDEEDRAAAEMFNGLKKLTIVDYEDCSPETKERFTRKLRRILRDEDVLMEASDDGERVRIYGLSNESGDVVKDMVIDAGDALICVMGTLRLDQVGGLMEEVDKQ